MQRFTVEKLRTIIREINETVEYDGWTLTVYHDHIGVSVRLRQIGTGGQKPFGASEARTTPRQAALYAAEGLLSDGYTEEAYKLLFNVNR